MNLLVFVKKKWQMKNILVVQDIYFFSVMILFKTFFLGKMKNGFLQKYIHEILFSYLFSSFGFEVIFWNWPNLLFLLSQVIFGTIEIDAFKDVPQKYFLE